MGFSISWIAFQNRSKADVLAELGLADTGEPDEANESPISGAELPTGWYVLFFNDHAHPFAGDASLQRFSAQGAVLGCHVEEHVMVSDSVLYENGVRRWRATHDAQQKRDHLAVEGTLPAALAEIQAQCLKAWEEAGGKEAGYDYVFEVPLELAKRLCGYKHDEVEFEWGEPEFTCLEPVGEGKRTVADGATKAQPKRGFLSRLSGGGS